MNDPNINVRVEDSIRARGPEYQRLLEHRRELERVRKREARKRQTPEQREHERARKREARLGQTPEQRERERKREGTRNRAKLRPFMAVDGEGGGTDEIGRQNYLLMVASGNTPGEERILHRDGKALSTRDCLEFILSLPAEAILGGYGIGYDVTQILRGIKPADIASDTESTSGKEWPLLHILGRLRDLLPARAVLQGRAHRPQRSDTRHSQRIVPYDQRNVGLFPMPICQGD
jgi:hypothetical protein